jgi:hypothetical protein
VVSHYAARGVDDLNKLFKSMSEHEAGHPYDLLIVSNNENLGFDESKTQVHRDVRLASESTFLPQEQGQNYREWSPRSTKHLVRQNCGMNIGAWDAGWRLAHKVPYSSFLFLQDEITVRKKNWVADLVSIASQKTNRNSKSIFLLGESINSRWNRSWDEIENENYDYLVHETVSGAQVTARRTTFYKLQLADWGISPQVRATHLRSLVWFTNIATLTALNGFRVGTSKESCIASEIGTSQKILMLGGVIDQFSEQPFFYFDHSEWDPHGKKKYGQRLKSDVNRS